MILIMFNVSMIYLIYQKKNKKQNHYDLLNYNSIGLTFKP